MNGLSTDVVALACILGGAAVGGVVTVAALDRDGAEESVCVSEVRTADPTVVVSAGETSRAIIVRPRVRVRNAEGCDAVVVDSDRMVEIRMDEARVRVEEARARMEEARIRVQEARIRIDEDVARELEARLEKEMERMERELARLEGGDVR